MENNTCEKLNLRQLKYQYLAVICVNLVTFCQGFSLGWVTPTLQILQSENSPLESGPITLEETILLGVLPAVGGLAGTLLFSILSNYLGRIVSISLLIFPNMAFWIILMTSNSINVILIGRLITGLTFGGVSLCIPLFVAEIADRRIRGFLGLILTISNSCGVLSMYICRTILDYYSVPHVILAVTVLFLLAMIILPETPSSLLRQNRIESAKKSIQFYNNGNDCVKNGFDTEAEISKLQILVNQRVENRKLSNWKLISNKQSLKGLATGLCLTAIVVMSGVFAITTFASHVFKKSNVNFDANLSAIIMGVLNLVGVSVSSMLMDSWGRRKLFGLSCTLSSVALMVFGTFTYLNVGGFDLSSFSWVPVTSVSFYIFVSAAGMRPLPFVYIAEVLPDNIRHIGTTICMFILTICIIISVGTLPILIEVVKLHTVMWIYSGICLLGLIFSIFIMEETKGKNLNGGH